MSQILSVHQAINTSFSSTQQLDLADLIPLLWLINKPLHIISDSAYVGLFAAVEMALTSSSLPVMLPVQWNYNIHLKPARVLHSLLMHSVASLVLLQKGVNQLMH